MKTSGFRGKLPHIQVAALSLFFLIFFSSFSRIYAQDTLKLMAWNLLKYGVSEAGCTPPTLDQKDGFLSTVLTAVKPDILGVVEMSGSSSLYSERILVKVLEPINAGYVRGTFTNNANSNVVNMIYFDSTKVTLTGEVVVNHYLRDINLYSFYHNSADLASGDTTFFTVAVMHLKAGDSSNDQSIREDQTSKLMAYLNAVTPGNLFVMGDFNIQNSSETSYQNMVAHTNTAIKLNDPVNTPGGWNNNSSFAAVHTQSTRVTSEPDCGSGSGLDDRFDFILINNNVKDGLDGAQYVPGTYQAYGQDGNLYDQPVNNSSNSAVSQNIANALYAASDHLPVVLDFHVDGAPVGRSDGFAGIQGLSLEIAGNPFGDELVLRVNSKGRETLNWELLDLQGKAQMAGVFHHQGLVKHRISTNELPTGFYLLRMQNFEGGIVVKKLIKR